MDKDKKKQPKAKRPKKREDRMSLKPLTLDEAVKGLLAIKPEKKEK